MADSSNSNSSSNNSIVSRASTAKSGKKKAELNRLRSMRANAASIRNNVTRRFGKLPKDLRAQAQERLKLIRIEEEEGSSEKKRKEEALFAKVNRAVKKDAEAKEAAKAAKKAEAAAAAEGRKRERTAATARKKAEAEAQKQQAYANLKEYLGESPKKKDAEAFYKVRKNAANFTMKAKNFAKAHGLHKKKNLTESQKKRRNFAAKAKKVAANLAAKGVNVDSFCEMAAQYKLLKMKLEAMHKEKGLKHTLGTVIDSCAPDAGMLPSNANSPNSS